MAKIEDEFVQEQYKEENCECGLTDDDTWSEAVFERFGCTCNG